MKKFIAALLVCVMVLSMLSAVSFAAELKVTTVTKNSTFSSVVDGVNLTAKAVLGNKTEPKDFLLEDNSATWSNIRKNDNDAIGETRIEASFAGGFSLLKGRKYQFDLDLGAKDENGNAVSNIEMYWICEDSTCKFAKYGPYADIRSLGDTGRSVIKSSFAEAAENGTMKTIKFLNKALKTDASAVRFLTLYSISVNEQITYCDTEFTIGANGSAKIASYADLDGENAVSDVALSDGDVKQFEKYSKPSFSVSADEGYVIDSLSFGDSEISAASGLASYAFTASEISGVSSMAVTFKKKDSVEERKNFAYITLSGNKTFYANEAANANISVKGYEADGTETVLTGSEFLTYTTSNPLIFTVDSGVVKSTDKFGMAIISAEYENKDGTKIKASVMFQRASNAKLFTQQSDFEGTHNFFTNTPGHVDGSAQCLAWNGLNDSWQLRGYQGANNQASGFNWKTNNRRVMTGWFYDDGEAASGPKFTMYYKNFYEKDNTKAFNYSEGVGTASATAYGIDSNGVIPRTKGWHQVVVTIDTRGIKNVYIDGILVTSVQLKLNCANVTGSADLKNGASYIEMRSANNGANPGWLYDDFSLAEYTNVKPEYSVKINAEGGSVNAGGASVGDGKSAEIIAENGSALKLSCDSGFEIVSVERVDSLALTEGSNEAVSLGASEYNITGISDDLIYNVVVKAKTSSEPSVSADSNIISSTAAFTYTGADGDVTVPEGTLSLVTYATLESADAEITECGFEISMYENGAQVGEALKLAAYAVPTGNGQYAIRTFGAGIKSGAEYKIRPYIVVDGNTVYGDYVSKTV